MYIIFRFVVFNSPGSEYRSWTNLCIPKVIDPCNLPLYQVILSLCRVMVFCFDLNPGMSLLRRRCRGRKRKKKPKRPRFWVRDISCQREWYGEYSNYCRNWKLEIENFILGVFTSFSYWLDTYLHTYFSFLPISSRAVISLKLFCFVLDHSINVDHNNEC